MNKELEEKINNAISEELPKSIGDVLRQRLDDADSMEEANENLLESVKDLEEEIKRLKSKIDYQNDYVSLRDDLDKSRSQLIEKDKELQIREAKLETKEHYSEQNRSDIFKLAKTVFSNVDACHVKASSIGHPAREENGVYMGQETTCTTESVQEKA